MLVDLICSFGASLVNKMALKFFPEFLRVENLDLVNIY